MQNAVLWQELDLSTAQNTPRQLRWGLVTENQKASGYNQVITSSIYVGTLNTLYLQKPFLMEINRVAFKLFRPQNQKSLFQGPVVVQKQKFCQGISEIKHKLSVVFTACYKSLRKATYHSSPVVLAIELLQWFATVLFLCLIQNVA